MRILKLILLFIIVSITWGTTWIAMKIIVETIPPLFATGMRFLLISPLLLIISYLNEVPLLFPLGKKKLQMLITIFYFFIPFTLMLYAGTYINSILSSMMFSIMPIVILIASWFFLKEKIFLIQILGITLAIVSLITLLIIKCDFNNYYELKGIFSIILAILSHAFIYIQCKIKCCNISVFTFNTLPSLVSGIILLILSLIIEHPSYQTFSIKSMLALFYLSNFSGLFGILSFFYLQKKVKSFISSIVFLIFPLISITLEKYIYKYNISKNEILIIIFLIIGTLLTLAPKIFVFKNLKVKK
ncbi:putative transporter [Buchnera aphidicola (Nipponaphis monzeni)]|uniref:Putative transporter n=1 Tax=Buchnera aphidicola (Nipponaphis monzeni) TaxID=2495405 RepID=A0A455TA72_9GAMM|nr:DMT family transporter [Buchnera aphidicola]BBI01232.1 putative transporter [Buchnera aphidicola (Nipponaphis monzeni)]